VELKSLINRLIESQSRVNRPIDVIYTNPLYTAHFDYIEKINLIKTYQFFVSNSPTNHYQISDN